MTEYRVKDAKKLFFRFRDQDEKVCRSKDWENEVVEIIFHDGEIKEAGYCEALDILKEKGREIKYAVFYTEDGQDAYYFYPE